LGIPNNGNYKTKDIMFYSRFLSDAEITDLYEGYFNNRLSN